MKPALRIADRCVDKPSAAITGSTLAGNQCGALNSTTATRPRATPGIASGVFCGWPDVSGVDPLPDLADERASSRLGLLREAGSGTREVTHRWLLPHLHADRRSVELGNSGATELAGAEGLGAACLLRQVVADLLANARLNQANQANQVNTPLPRMLRQG